MNRLFELLDGIEIFHRIFKFASVSFMNKVLLTLIGIFLLDVILFLAYPFLPKDELAGIPHYGLLLVLPVVAICIIIWYIFYRINKASMSSLSRAAADGDTRKCSELIENGAKIDAKTLLGDTAIIYAAMNGRRETLEYLISKGASVDIYDVEHKTPLLAAVEYCSGHELIEIMKVLLDVHADTEITDNLGKTVLWHAVRRKNAEAVNLLIQKGANVNATYCSDDRFNQTEVYNLEIDKNYRSVLDDVPPDAHEIRKMLIDAGAKETFLDGKI